MFCKFCGQEIDDRAVICPKCGRVLNGDANQQIQYAQNGQIPQSSAKTNTLAIVGFILSFFVPIAGLICSIIAKRQIRETGESGNGFATAGIVISSVDLGISLIYAIVYGSIFLLPLLGASCMA